MKRQALVWVVALASVCLTAFVQAGVEETCEGGALWTDGTAYVMAGAGALWHQQSEFTLRMWVRPDEGTDGTEGVLAGNGGFVLRITDGTTVSFEAGEIVLVGEIDQGVWTHIAVVVEFGRTERMATLLIEGQNVARTSFSTPLAYDDDEPLVLGRGFSGSIDEFALFDWPVLLEDIDPFSGLFGNERGLVVYYVFNTEGTITDVTGHSYHGTLVDDNGIVLYPTNCELEGPCDPDAISKCVPAPHWALPDMLLLDDRLSRSMHLDDRFFSESSCALNEQCVNEPGDRLLLRFDTATANNGNVDLILGRPGQSEFDFIYDDCHGHYHFIGYAKYEVFDVSGKLATVGRKQAFCLLDSGRYNDYSGEGEVSRFPQYHCSNQGISTGWMDVYSSGLDCQWIDVTDVPGGEYILKVTLNSHRLLRELNYANNVHYIPFTLEDQGSCKETEYYSVTESTLDRDDITDLISDIRPIDELNVLSMRDDSYTEVSLPWLFPFYCRYFDRIYVVSNGFLSFVPSDDYENNFRVKSNSISVFHDDLVGNNRNVFWRMIDDDTMLFAYFKIKPYSETDIENSLTFGVLLHSNGNIEFLYVDTSLGNSEHSLGNSATVGIRESGDNEIKISYNRPNIRPLTSIKFEFEGLAGNPPVAVPGGPYSGIAGLPIELDGTQSFDPDGDAVIEYVWTMGDGQPPLLGPTPSAYYRKPGTYTATLRVSDGLFFSDNAEFEVEVDANDPPSVVSLSAVPTSASPGEAVTFTVEGSDPENGPIVFIWNFGDGSIDIESEDTTVTYSYANDGTYTVSVVAYDGLHHSDAAVVEITVV